MLKAKVGMAQGGSGFARVSQPRAHNGVLAADPADVSSIFLEAGNVDGSSRRHHLNRASSCLYLLLSRLQNTVTSDKTPVFCRNAKCRTPQALAPIDPRSASRVAIMQAQYSMTLTRQSVSDSISVLRAPDHNSQAFGEYSIRSQKNTSSLVDRTEVAAPNTFRPA
jgi:hypothetical protein